MPTIKFAQGDDKKLELLIVKNGLPVDIQDNISVKAELFVNDVSQKIYSSAPSTNEGTLEVPVTPVNKINIFIERADSVNFPVGSGYVNILVAFDDATFPDGNRVESFKIYGIVIQKGVSLNIDIP